LRAANAKRNGNGFLGAESQGSTSGSAPVEPL